MARARSDALDRAALLISQAAFPRHAGTVFKGRTLAGSRRSDMAAG